MPSIRQHRPSPRSGVPEARNLTQATGVRAMIYDVPKARPDVLYVGLNDRDPAWHDLYELNIATGTRTLMRRNEQRVTRWLFDLGGRLRLAERSAPKGDAELLRIDGVEFTPIYRCSVLETRWVSQFHNDATSGLSGDESRCRRRSHLARRYSM